MPNAAGEVHQFGITISNWITIVSATLVIVGWFVSNYLTSNRESDARKNEIVVNYLIDAYDKLSDASWRLPTDDLVKSMEISMAKIQLLGSPEEVRLANEFMIEFDNSRKEGQRQRASLDPLLFAIRNALRERLSLPPLENKVRWLRMKGVPEM